MVLCQFIGLITVQTCGGRFAGLAQPLESLHVIKLGPSRSLSCSLAVSSSKIWLALSIRICSNFFFHSRFHRATAPSLIKHFRDCVKGAPRELYANVLLTAGPAGQDSLVVIQMCYVGPKVKGQEFLQAISSWDGERCLLNEVDEKSFLHQQDSVAQVLRGNGMSFTSTIYCGRELKQTTQRATSGTFAPH